MPTCPSRTVNLAIQGQDCPILPLTGDSGKCVVMVPVPLQPEAESGLIANNEGGCPRSRLGSGNGLPSQGIPPIEKKEGVVKHAEMREVVHAVFLPVFEKMGVQEWIVYLRDEKTFHKFEHSRLGTNFREEVAIHAGAATICEN